MQQQDLSYFLFNAEESTDALALVVACPKI